MIGADFPQQIPEKERAMAANIEGQIASAEQEWLEGWKLGPATSSSDKTAFSG